MKTKEELTQLAKDYCSNLIFSDRDCENEKEIADVFMILRLMTEAGRKSFMETKPVFLYEYYKDAAPLGVNGKPMFFSARSLNKEEFDFFQEQVKKISEFMRSL